MGTVTIDTANVEIKEEILEKHTEEEVEDLEWSADQEILLLYSLHGYKPVGPNKHFRMLLIQDRLSNAMNKNISSKAIWKKLNTLYDLEALDEAEAEADAVVAVDTEFSLPEDEYGDLIAERLKEHDIKIEKFDQDSVCSDTHIAETLCEVKTEPDLLQDNDTESSKETIDTPKGGAIGKEVKKESVKRTPKKKESTPIKDNALLKKDTAKETLKKDIQNKKEVVKESKKGTIKDDDKKEFGKKTTQELKKEITKEDKKETGTKTNKRELADKKFAEQNKKDVDLKKTEQKKNVDTLKTSRVETFKPRTETPKQLRTETSKRADPKALKFETTKSQRTETTPKPQRIEALKKESSGDKKKETPDKKVERKSPEKTPESARGSKLRTRERKDTESEKSESTAGTKRERSRDSTSKTPDGQTEEPPAKKVKTLVTKGRPTRNSIEPQQKPTSPVVNPLSPQKRRTRML